ncbi:hypothetical protein [Flavobacterium sp. N1994]|uniref:hypothetical protein n=1 Tax=Flavobacterium sp. N1994 TaxID=2986827 RepID=UPI00222259D3|nr:hypothetical protein [Flavobacterium sp. N1994]
MKTLYYFRTMLLLFLALTIFSCSSGRYPNSGTASDRTGANGATNGTGKAPRGNSHDYKYQR